ncbi:MAG: methionyl-tRNA formyltransferase [Candidatus Aminicenantes bacterium]|nr:methionyl-tRNA formyltransferase [Candidatus Aminicenantes bacterium]
MKIVFFGSPAAAIPSLKEILRAGHSVELVITQPDKPSGRGNNFLFSPVKRLAIDEKIPLHQPQKIRKDQMVLDKLKSIEPDVNVVVAYGQIMPAPVIYLPRYNTINLHFSLLPKYRGASPVQWAILNDEQITGLTVFELNEKMDEGGILTQEEVDIIPGETAPELEHRLAERGAGLLTNTLSRIKEIKPRKQDHSKATFAPRIKKEDGLIVWTHKAGFIERQIRAFTSWPSSYTYLGRKRIKIISGKHEPSKASRAHPGEIVKSDKEGIRVMCGDGNIFRIDVLQPENKTKMNAYAFSLGANIRSGQTFG